MDSTTPTSSDNDIAIVSVALRVPGANDPERFWQNLSDGVESVRTFSDDELREAGVSPAELANPNYVRSGAPMEGMDLFDAEFFGFGPKEAAIMDPQHRHFLECSWEALERAGHVPANFEGAIGVFTGCGMGSYFAHNILTNRDLIESVGMFLLRHTGNDKDFLATRASYCFDLHGPSVNVQTACSTSLVAVHLACQSLLSGECDMALAGGVTIEIPHRQGYMYHEGEILSPDGHCRPFDHRAEGTIFGSGVGVVVLRRLSDAIADGDSVIAVIKGSAVNNDGSRKVGYLAPSVDGQAAAIVEALNLANVSADSIGLVECHGTGTAMGDPIEIAALTQAFSKSSERKGYCAVGSVKSNIGHLDTAAGVVALIKASLSLRHKTMPPSLNYERPNPQIEFEQSPFFVNDTLRPWPAGKTPRRASVNSLGVGGTNAHVILEEPPAAANKPAARPVQPGAAKPVLLMLAARNKRSLAEGQKRLAAHLREHPELSLADVAHTLHTARARFDVRRVLAATSREDALRILEDDSTQLAYTHTRRDRPTIVFMFPGGGAQYPRMAAGLYNRDSVYREHIDRGLELAKKEHGLDLRALLLPSDAELPKVASELERPSLQLPLLFLVEYALAQSWIARGVTPAVLIGHSMGENTAACVAGVMSFQTALGLVALRGKLFETVPEGGMLSVPLSAAELAPLLPEGVVVACENAPSLSVASGPRAGLDALITVLAARGVEAQTIRIRIAAHSPMLEPILKDFGDYLRRSKLSAPTIPIVSNLTGAVMTVAEATDPEYWVRHLRSTVKFERGVATLEAEGSRVYLEVGPGRVLGSLVRQCVNDTAANPPIASLRHPDQSVDDETFLLAALGRLWASGASVDVAPGLPATGQRVPLPTYAFDHKPYFIAPGKVVTEGTSAMRRIAELGDWFFRPVWRWRELEPEELSGPTGQTYLLFADDLGIADALGERLRSRGHRTVFVRKSGAYGQTDVFEYEVAPHAPHAYSTLVQELMASEKLPDRILHLWSVDDAADLDAAWTYAPARRKTGFDSLFHLMHAFGAEGVTQTMHLTAVTTGAARLMNEPLPHPEKAMVSGICQVIPRESPSISASWLDLPLPRRARSWLRSGLVDNMDSLVTCLESEARSQRKGGTIAYRDGRRFEHDYEAAPRSAAGQPQSKLREQGVYLITGGLGGIGLALAKHLAQQHSARLLLVARTGLPATSEWERFTQAHPPEHPLARRIAAVRELEALGAQVEVVKADVTNLGQMREAFARGRARFGRVHGAFHAAGVLDDELLALKSISDAEEVLKPKVEGTWVLHQLGIETGLELLVLFSSTSTLIGPPGQSDYVAANAFLNAYAESRRGRPGPTTVAVQWGVWRDVGMAAEAGRGMRPQETPRETISKVQGPFFDTRRDSPDGSVILEGRHAATQTWWLDDHRLADGTAVVPGTGYLQLMAVAAGTTGIRRPFEVRDAMFVRPLAIDESTPIRVRMRRDEQGQGIEVQSTYREDGVELGWVTHALGSLSAVDALQPPAVDLEVIRKRCSGRVFDQAPSIRTSQEAHLRFGPRFRCLRKAYFGQGEALGELALDPELFGDIETTPLHAGLLDLGTGFAMDLIPGYAADQGLWAPLSYGKLRLFAPLPAQCVTWVRVAPGSDAKQGTIRFDVDLCDPQGHVCVKVEQLTLRKVPAGQTLSQLGRPASHEIEKDGAAVAASKSKASPSAAETVFQGNLAAGITPREGGPALELVLSGTVPSTMVISSLEPRLLVRQMDESSMQKLPTSTRFARPELDTAYVAPTESIHKELATIWEQILGIDGIGIRDGFFELGGHSLTAVRLSAEVRKRFEVELPLSSLFEAPTIERLGELLASARASTPPQDAANGNAGAAAGGPATPAAAGLREFSPVVPIKPKGSLRPLFCVAGQGGNPMHLRTLAHYLGPQRPFYGLQHRGLDARSVPYSSVEEMATDYIKHIAAVDPGPYLIAGYSGGGTAAFEMARQLRAAGKGVDAILLFDSFCPLDADPGIAWRIRTHLEALQSEGAVYARRRLMARLKRERQWLEQRFFNRKQVTATQSRSMFETAAANWQAIEARYRPLPFQASAYLFRVDSHDPDDAKYFAERYGGWSRLLTMGVQSFVVPGTHVSMCEEPNVQVLAEKLRAVLDELDSTSRAAQ